MTVNPSDLRLLASRGADVLHAAIDNTQDCLALIAGRDDDLGLAVGGAQDVLIEVSALDNLRAHRPSLLFAAQRLAIAVGDFIRKSQNLSEIGTELTGRYGRGQHANTRLVFAIDDAVLEGAKLRQPKLEAALALSDQFSEGMSELRRQFAAKELGLAEELEIIDRVAVLSLVLLVLARRSQGSQEDTSIGVGPRRAELTAEETQQVVAEFEAVRQYLVEANNDKWIPEEHEAYVLWTLEELALVRQRAEHGPVNPQQIELLIADLVRVLNGSIQDGPLFEREFIRLGVDEATAAVAADRLVAALHDIEELGADDPVEDGLTADAVVEVAEVVDGVLDEVGREMAKTAGREVTESGVGFAMRQIKEHGLKISVAILIAVARVTSWLFGWD